MELENSLEKMSRKNLIKYCKDNQIKSISNKNKKELLLLITTYLQNKLSNDEKDSIKLDIIESCNQTKEWRKQCTWYKNGKSNECENYQKKILKQLLGYEIAKCNYRFYIETNDLITKSNPMKYLDGFEYTEDFDGKCTSGTKTIYFNLKFCCDSGGAQTRTLRLVYDFIKCQIQYINKIAINVNNFNLEELSNTYFINILDGDNCNTHMSKFRYILDKLNDKKLEKYVFIGSMYDFSKEQRLIDLLRN